MGDYFQETVSTSFFHSTILFHSCASVFIKRGKVETQVLARGWARRCSPCLEFWLFSSRVAATWAPAARSEIPRPAVRMHDGLMDGPELSRSRQTQPTDSSSLPIRPSSSIHRRRRGRRPPELSPSSSNQTFWIPSKKFLDSCQMMFMMATLASLKYMLAVHLPVTHTP